MQAVDQQSVEESIRRAHEGEDYERAATLLIEGYGPQILAFCAGRLQSRQEADEVFSLFCEDVWKGLAGFAWRSSARAWAYTVARHAMSRYLSGAGRHKRDLPLSRSPELVARVRTRTETLLRTESKSKLRELIRQLPEADQLLLSLRLERELSFAELAVVMSDAPDALDDAGLTREAARLRKRFQLVKERLKVLGEQAGLFGKGE